ncbi:MAG TPA: MFS transporter, partial [Burkholderiaceae bacterium]|nr:MFS transporter [Burkholderiaceae bacterium]
MAPSFLQVHWLLPAGADRRVGWLLASRSVRGFADGFVAVLLPAYLAALGLGVVQIGVLGTLTLAGSAAATIALGTLGHRWPRARLMSVAALTMVATGLGFAGFASFWPLAAVAFIGTLNPSSGDVSVFLPLEHARLAHAAEGPAARTALFARYALLGSLSAALGALASAWPAAWVAHVGGSMLSAMRAMFVLYAATGLVVAGLYRAMDRAARVDGASPASLSSTPSAASASSATSSSSGSSSPSTVSNTARAAQRVRDEPHQPLGPSRAIVVRLAALFCVDSFASGLLVNALLALWLFHRFGLSLAEAGRFFFWSGLLTTASQLLAPALARRIGLVNTMVWTHLPASVCLIGAAFAPGLPLALALLFMRSALSSMDVPARSAFVMSVVTAPERAAAASFTAVPRSLASAAGPAVGASLLAAGFLGAPLVACGALKLGYDLMLLAMFRR